MAMACWLADATVFVCFLFGSLGSVSPFSSLALSVFRSFFSVLSSLLCPFFFFVLLFGSPFIGITLVFALAHVSFPDKHGWGVLAFHWD